MSAWHVDRGLATLITQWRQLHPGAIVGTIAGGTHTKSHTDHVPDNANSIDAADFMPGKGVTQADLDWLFNTLARNRDPRIAYMIRRNRITSSTIQPWIYRQYDGHYHTHLHVSVNDKHAEDAAPWRLGEKVVMQAVNGHLPVLTPGMVDPIDSTGWHHVSRMQLLCGAKADGNYGPATVSALKTWLTKRGHTQYNGRTCDVHVWRLLAGIRA